MKGVKILLIEDEVNIALMIRKFLESEGFEVFVENNGVAGVERAFSEKPDLILLDLVLPKMNGFLVCETLKSDGKTRNIPILVISAKAEEHDIKRAKELGADDYIVKPIEIKNLLKAIKKYL